MKPSKIAVIVLLACGWHLSVQCAPRAAPAQKVKPPKAQVRALLKKALPKEQVRVSKVLSAIGHGHYPVLFVAVTTDCYTRDVPDEAYKECMPSTSPHLALVKQESTGQLTIVTYDKLPTAQSPWDNIEPMQWGFADIKDYDGDGRPELFIIYGYTGPTYPAIGETRFRDLAIVNLDERLSIAFHATLDELPVADTLVRVESTYKLVPPTATPTNKAIEIVVTKETSEDQGFDKERKLTRTVTRFRHNPSKDAWIEGKQ